MIVVYIFCIFNKNLKQIILEKNSGNTKNFESERIKTWKSLSALFGTKIEVLPEQIVAAIDTRMYACMLTIQELLVPPQI